VLQQNDSVILADKAFSLGGNVSSWGGLRPVYCSNMPKSFCWDLDYSRLEISPAFWLLLERIDVDPAKALKFDFHGYRRYSCPNQNCDIQEIYLPVISCGSYHPHQSFKHVSRCIDRVLGQIDFLEKRVSWRKSKSYYLICLDLTCPGEVSKRVMDPGVVKRLRRAVNIFIAKLGILLFPGKKSQLGGFYAVHIWKTSKPIDPHLHVHLQLFNVAYNAREKRFYRFKPMISHTYVKKAWRDALKSQGLWDNPLEQSYPDCYIHYIKLEDRGRVIHRLRYVFRRPIVDLNSNLALGDLQGEVDPVWIRRLLSYVPRRVKVGFMTNLKRLGYVCRKSFFERCPICGGVLRKLEFVPGNLPEFPHFVRDRSGKWIPIDPPSPIVSFK